MLFILNTQTLTTYTCISLVPYLNIEGDLMGQADTRLPPLGVPSSRLGHSARVSWVGFSRFSLPLISFHNFSTLNSFISFHLILSSLWWCDRRGRSAFLLLTDRYSDFIATHPPTQRWVGNEFRIFIYIIIIIIIFIFIIIIVIIVKQPGGSLPPLDKLVVGPYLKQHLSILQDHNVTPSNPF